MKNNKTHFDLFKAECKRLLDKLGLKDWDITIQEALISEESEAEIQSDVEGKVATITLNKRTQNDKHIDVERIARHEIAHLLLQNIMFLAESRFTSERELRMEEERLATILEKAL